MGCNLATTTTLTATPPPFATITPLLSDTLATPLPGVVVPTPPAPIPTESQNAIEWVIAQIVIPAWNFVYTLIINGAVALWVFAGDRGGITAQFCGCVLPAVVIGILVVRSTLRRVRVI